MQQARSPEHADQQHREILTALEADDTRRAASPLAECWHDGERQVLRRLADMDPTAATTPG